MSEERKTFLVTLPTPLVDALDKEAQDTKRRYRSPQLEYILSERYGVKVAEEAGPTTKRKRAA